MAKTKDDHLHLSEKPFSLLQSNEFFASKILSRNSSFGRSARGLPSCRRPGQIPFNWEAQPGQPKDQPSEIPPPADLPPPSESDEDLSESPDVVVPKQEAVKVWFWKKPKRKVRHVIVAKKNGAFGSRRHVDRDQSELCRKSTDESSSSSSCISSSLSSSSSSASSSTSNGNGYGRRRSKLGSLAKGFIRTISNRTKSVRFSDILEYSTIGSVARLTDTEENVRVGLFRCPLSLFHKSHSLWFAVDYPSPNTADDHLHLPTPRRIQPFALNSINAGQRHCGRRMYGSQFDGNAAFSGGGFMPSQTTPAPDHSFSPAKNRDVQALLPLTVKQINDAFLSSDDKSNFVIDGVDVNNVKLVGMVRNRAGRITDVTFALDDGTGRIDCSKWVNEAADSNEVEGILDGMYVRVHGHLKSFQGKRTLNVFSIRPVTDYNEITNHFIECIYVHFYNTRLRKQPSSSMSTQPAMSNLSNTTPMKGYQAPISNQYSGQAGGGDGWKSLEQRILDFLQLPSCDNERGAHRDVLAQNLKVPLEKLMPAMKNLEEEGLIYSTTDDYHFKSTANG